MNRFLHSVRLRLTLWYAGVLAIALALFALSVYVFVVRSLQAHVDLALQTYGQQLNRTAASHVHGKSLDVNSLPVPVVPGHEPIAAILFMNAIGRTKRIARAHAGSPATQELRIAIRSGKESCGTQNAAGGTIIRHSPLRFCIKLLYHAGKPVGGVEVVESLAGVNNALDRLRLALILGIPFVLILAGSGGWLLAGRALEPVNEITDMARSITATDLSRRINLDRQDELGRLAGTFDEMIDRLERAFHEQRQLTADVSHELRSPLTILEAQTTLALRRARTPEEYQHVLMSVQEEVEHLTTMVNQLLTLARADAGEERIELVPIPLHSVAASVVETMTPLAEESGIRLRMHGDGAVWVTGDAGRLRQLLINLLDNALEYTHPGGQIEVLVRAGLDGPILRVADNGEGIAAEDLPHVFRRFYRSDRARRRGTGHSGLGLAIAQWIVDAHGGRIRVESTAGEGARFTVVLRHARAPSRLEAVSRA